MRLRLGTGEWSFSYLGSHRRADDFYVLGSVDDGFNAYDTRFDAVSLCREFDWLLDQKTDVAISYRAWAERIDFKLLPEGYLDGKSSPNSSDPFWVKADIHESEFALSLLHDWSISPDMGLLLGLEYRNPNAGRARAYSNFDFSDLASGNLPVRYFGDFSRFTDVSAPV